MWEKTVMSDEQIAKIYGDRQWICFMPDINRSREIAKAQAEISYKAGYTDCLNTHEENDAEQGVIEVLDELEAVKQARQEGREEVVEFVEEHAIYAGDFPPQEGKGYIYLGNYILSFGKEANPTAGFYEIKDADWWQAFKKENGL